MDKIRVRIGIKKAGGWFPNAGVFVIKIDAKYEAMLESAIKTAVPLIQEILNKAGADMAFIFERGGK